MAAAAAGVGVKRLHDSSGGGRTTDRRHPYSGEAAGGGGGGAAGVDDVPLLVRVLAGNPATSAAILACLDTVDASRLRRLHPAVCSVVAGVPWADMATAVMDIVRWRAAFPAAVGATVSNRPPAGERLAQPALAALAGVMHLNLGDCGFVTDELLLRLPASLRVLNVSRCFYLTESASFVHLTALTTLNCRGTWMGEGGLPVSLQELSISVLPAGASLARLVLLRVLHAYRLEAGTLASLPPSLLELYCTYLLPGELFTHLAALHTLDVTRTAIDDASLASMPPSLVSLNAHGCMNLTPAAVLPPLPALRLLGVSDTGIGDALVASLPAGLEELRIACCGNVTAGSTLDHVPALHTLHSIGTDLAPGVLDSCRARGCAVPAAGVLRGHWSSIWSLAVLADGRLASSDSRGEVRAWDVAAGGGEAGVILNTASGVDAMVALRDGHGLAAGMDDGRIEIWEVGVVPPARTSIIACSGSGVRALVVLRGDRLAAGCVNGKVWVVDVDAGTVAAKLVGHTGKIR